MDDAQCDLYLQQYFAEGTEFVLSTRLPDAEQCVAVFACEEKRQSEILRKLRMFVSKYTEYTVAVGYFVDSLSGVYNSSRLAQIAMERGYFEPEVHYLEVDRLVQRKYIDPGIYQVFLQVYKENPWRIREWYQALLQQFATKKQAMTEGAQIIALTRTFASQILNDYPESLTAVGESDVETYMRQLERTSNIRETEQQFDLLLNGMERCLVEQNRYSRLSERYPDILYPEFIGQYPGRADDLRSVSSVCDLFKPAVQAGTICDHQAVYQRDADGAGQRTVDTDL